MTVNAVDGTGFNAYTSAGQISKETDADTNAQSGINANWITIKLLYKMELMQEMI